MKKTLIRVRLAITQRWAVGRVPNAAEEIHVPVVTDPRNGTRRPYVPATGLAGALRRHLGESAERWLGPEPTAWEEAQSGRADRKTGQLWLLGTFTEPAAGQDAGVEVRGVTSIDASRRAAARGGLRFEEWNPATNVTVLMTHDDDADDALLDALAAWTPTIGRSTSTGMGRAHVVLVEHLTLDLDDDAHLTWWLTQRDSWLHRADAAVPPIPVPEPRQGALDLNADTSWNVGWIVSDPLHVGVGKLGTDAPSASGREVQRTMTVDGAPVVPGSSWKGVVRGRVEAILALLGVSRRADVLAYLFGSTEKGSGLLGFDDSRIPTETMPGGLLYRTHVAIDRFTGGARDSGLFVVEAIPERTPVTLTIRHAGPLPAPVKNLIGHVLWDIHDGLAGVGGMVTRGYGGLTFDTEPERPSPVDPDALIALLDTPISAREGGDE